MHLQLLCNISTFSYFWHSTKNYVLDILFVKYDNIILIFDQIKRFSSLALSIIQGKLLLLINLTQLPVCDSYVQPNYKCYTCGKIASRAVKNLKNAAPKRAIRIIIE